MKIVYVGLKEMKADNIAGTGLVWTRGEIHEVEDPVKAAKLLEHTLIWQNADAKYELLPAPAVVQPDPRVNIIPSASASPYWEPVVIPVPGDVFARLQKKELVAVFIKADEADAYADWKLARDKQLSDTAPAATGPKVDISKMDKRSKEYKELAAKQSKGSVGLESAGKKAA